MTVEIFSKSQTDIERLRLDMEMEIRDMQYHAEQEREAKTSAEGLVAQLREQMKRAEEKLAVEAEARQTIELSFKTLEAEFNVRENLANQLESDVNDLRFTLHREREARINQEQIYNEELQQHEALLEEAQKTSRQHVQAVSQLKVIDQNCKSAQSTADQLKVELAKTKAELEKEQATNETIVNDLQQSNDTRESLEKNLASLKTSNMHLEEKLQSESLFRAQHERSSRQHKDLWSSEVKSRSKLGLQLVAMEKEVHRLKNELAEETERRKGMESQLEHYDRRSLQSQKETTALRNKLKQCQRSIKVYSEFERERDVMMNNTSNLRREVDTLSDQLRQEQEKRTKSEVSSKKNDQELAALRAREKDLSYEREKLEDERDKLKDYYERNYMAKSSLATYKKEIETKARLEINNKLRDVNLQLDEQAAAREAYDRVRNETESKSKKELEETINGLKNELSHVKSALQDGIGKHSSYQTEANRIRELYKKESAEKHKLSAQVTTLSERFAAANARLGMEKSRNQQLMDLASSLRISPGKSGNATFKPAEREDYLSRSGLRTMDLDSSIPLSMDAFATSSQRPNTSAHDYLSSLRRNYQG